VSRPVHFEILADDPEKVAAFYREVWSWKIATWEGPQAYWLVTTGPEGAPGINGAIMHREFPQAVINTVGVESLEEALAKVKQAGGKVIQGPNMIPGIGVHAYCTDPEGNMFGILEPLPAMS
jgi:predicted enzyme related to lactoylglutathione lyase